MCGSTAQLYCINRDSKAQSHYCTICDTRSKFVVKHCTLLHEPKFQNAGTLLYDLQFLLCTFSWAQSSTAIHVVDWLLNSTFTAIYAVRTQFYYKFTAINGARAQIDCSSTAWIAVDAPAAFGWSYLYIYFIGYGPLIILLLQKVVSSNLITTMITRSAIHTMLCEQNMQYISCNYVLPYERA